VGISLSGGLDSTALAALAARQLDWVELPQERLKSFSCTFDELKACDERRHIQPVVDLYGLDSTFIPSDDKWTLCDLSHWPVDQGFVLSDPYAWLPQAVTTAAQKAGCRALLTGHYGDVLFASSQYWAADMVRDLRLGELGWTLLRNAKSLRWRTELAFGLRALAPRKVRRAYRRLRPHEAPALHQVLTPSFLKRTDLQDRTACDSDKRRFRTLSQWARHRSLTLSVFSQGAGAVRKMYNRHGVELVTPYWDRRLVEFVMSVPADQLGRPHRTRWLHRNAMLGLLPETVVERRHQTRFVDLFERGLLREETDVVRSLLRDPQIVQRQIVRAPWIENTLASESIDSPDWGLLWLCISLELWLQRCW
jgi:asparagine synthase (glutamine-hydrolysing)